MSVYTIVRDGQALRLGFGDVATNREVVPAVAGRLRELEVAGELPRGGVIGLNGRASLPVVAAITHVVAHLCAALAVYDPKLSGYVISLTHDPRYTLGEVLTEEQLQATASQ